jgi:hypothetical protein
MAPEGQVGQKEMKCILKFEMYFHMSQCYSGERCGPWASCFYCMQSWLQYLSLSVTFIIVVKVNFSIDLIFTPILTVFHSYSNWVSEIFGLD